MSFLEQWVVSNALFIVPMVLVIFLITRRLRNPYFAHALWLLVLLKLITPPFIELPLPQLLTVSQALTSSGDSMLSSSPRQFAGDLKTGDQQQRVTNGKAVAQTTAAREIPAHLRATPQQHRTRLPLDIRRLALLTWLVGALFVSARAAWHIVTFNRILALAAEADTETTQCALELARSMGLCRIPRMLRVDRPIAPALWAGNFHPAIILPARIFSQLDSADRQAVIAHELAHFARRDHWVRWLELLVTTAYWWHPLVWLSRYELRNVEELCCDTTAIAHCAGTTGRDYAATLLTLMDRFDDRQLVLASGMGSKQQLKKRLLVLANERLPAALSGTMRTALLVIALLILPIQLVSGQNDGAARRQLQRGRQSSSSEADVAETQPGKSKARRETTSLLRPGDVVVIEVAGALPEMPIGGQFLIESEGGVALGPIYGRVKISGHSIEQAEALITQHLSKILQVPEVMVRHPLAGRLHVDVPDAPYQIETGDVLQIRVAGALPEQPIEGLFRVETSGKVAMGPSYGRAQIAGLSLEESERAIGVKLAEILQAPEVSVTHGQWLHNPPSPQLRSDRMTDLASPASVVAQQQYIRLLEGESARAEALRDANVQDGFDSALAGIELELARGELAAMQSDQAKSLEAYHKAKKYADVGMALAKAGRDAGVRTLKDVLLMAQKQQQVKRALLRSQPSRDKSSAE